MFPAPMTAAFRIFRMSGCLWPRWLGCLPPFVTGNPLTPSFTESQPKRRERMQSLQKEILLACRSARKQRRLLDNSRQQANTEEFLRIEWSIRVNEQPGR